MVMRTWDTATYTTETVEALYKQVGGWALGNRDDRLKLRLCAVWLRAVWSALALSPAIGLKLMAPGKWI